MSITAKSSATIIPFSAVTKGNFEKSKDLWLIQVFADKSLTNGTKNVAAMIGLHMNRGQHGLAYPGFGLLAKLTGLCRRTIIRAVKALERAGHVVIECQAVTPERPDDREDAHQEKALHHHAEYIFFPHKAAIKQREPRCRHHQHKC